MSSEVSSDSGQHEADTMIGKPDKQLRVPGPSSSLYSLDHGLLDS